MSMICLCLSVCLFSRIRPHSMTPTPTRAIPREDPREDVGVGVVESGLYLGNRVLPVAMGRSSTGGAAPIYRGYNHAWITQFNSLHLVLSQLLSQSLPRWNLPLKANRHSKSNFLRERHARHTRRYPPPSSLWVKSPRTVQQHATQSSFVVAQGTLLWWPINRNWPPSLVALALRNGVQYHLAYACVNSATNASTSYKSLVKTGPVTSAKDSLECGHCAATRPQYDDRRLFCSCTLAFENGLEYRNFDCGMLISNHFCTLCRNFVRFGLVIPEFKT